MKLSNEFVRDRWPTAFIVVYGIALIVLALITGGTGDDGDSVMHYLFAHYAFEHPDNLLDHWAKPLFTLLAAPFAQFGFDGIQVFNIICATTAIWATWQVALHLKLINANLVVLFSGLMPLYIILALSGLTELLFAALLSLILLLLVRERLIWAILLAGLLPFVRSEGWILDFVLIGYLIFNRAWKFIPLIAVGHLVYMVIGAFVLGDFWWPFTHNPYAHLESPYGSGSWFHFVPRLMYLTGVPIYILLVAGVLAGIIRIFRIRGAWKDPVSVIVAGGFGAFFLAHTTFWALGTVNSAGLLRVFLAVVPLMGLLALMGFNWLFELHRLGAHKLIQTAKWLFVMYVVAFPFLPHGAALQWKHFQLRSFQKMANEVAWAVEEIPGYEEATIYYAYPYVSIVLDIDPFDAANRKGHLNNLANHPRDRPAIVIWDSNFAVNDLGITLDKVEEMDWLQDGPVVSKMQGQTLTELRVFWYVPD